MNPVHCSFAGCARLGEHFEPDGKWHFCEEHFRIHLALRREEHRLAQETKAKPARQLQPCGSHAAYERHRSRGEYPCPPCREAERLYQARRYRRRAS